ncbi:MULTISPECIES: hypothetical protein [Paenibacillus]|uniref:hypothetical protein n=1 Tax=Paenibacillus TaxID=44249 RepID=UPI0017812508|nr:MULTISPECIES: hypothetical protein [Paenibacillus]QOS79440.1 hypothetical protein JNUCC31_00235 [Paenibacillus sp. JNUCC-31]UPK41137.1 hypothetical protein KET34_17595 [Paenibacillus pabuli]
MGKNRGRLYHRNDNYLEELSAAYRNIPSPVRSSSEVTTNVINRLLNEREGSRYSRSVRKNMATRVAVMLCVFVLVGGTGYAAYFEYVLSLNNKSGDTVFQIAPTDIPSPPVEEISILDDIRETLKDGEQATVFIGKKADEEQKGEVLPQNGSHYSMVVKPLEFDSPERMNDYLLERGVEINIPLSKWMGWSLNRAELQNDILSTSSKEKVWNFATDDQTGTRYKYTIGPSGTEPQFLSWFYSKQKKEIRVNASLNIPVMPIFYDSKPSSDSILSIKGVDAYFYRDLNGSEKSINWSKKVADGNYRSYAVVTKTADDEDLRNFAAAIISNQK